jgi:hypothetical protein
MRFGQIISYCITKAFEKKKKLKRRHLVVVASPLSTHYKGEITKTGLL